MSLFKGGGGGGGGPKIYKPQLVLIANVQLEFLCSSNSAAEKKPRLNHLVDNSKVASGSFSRKVIKDSKEIQTNSKEHD